MHLHAMHNGMYGQRFMQTLKTETRGVRTFVAHLFALEKLFSLYTEHPIYNRKYSGDTVRLSLPFGIKIIHDVFFSIQTIKLANYVPRESNTMQK